MPVRPRNNESRAALSAAEKRRLWFNLRVSGMTPSEIARQQNVAVSTVTRALRRGLREVYKESAEELATLELARLDQLTTASWQDALRGKPAAIDAIVKISKRRSEITGMDAPTKRSIDATFSGELDTGNSTDDYRALVAAIFEATQDNPELRYQIAAKLEHLPTNQIGAGDSFED